MMVCITPIIGQNEREMDKIERKGEKREGETNQEIA